MFGFSINNRQRAVAVDWCDKFKSIPVANVSDCMSRVTAGGPRIRPMHDGTPMVGVAVTVRTRPGDNLMLHKALMMAGPNDVVVVDGGGDLTNSLFGEIMLQYAAFRGIAGLVIDGAIRDYDAIHGQSMPVFAAGVTHRGPYKDGPGQINVPIAIDGMVIHPGDLVIGDGDGFLCVPFDAVEEMYGAARIKHADELSAMAAGDAGQFKRDWVDTILRERGCTLID